MAQQINDNFQLLAGLPIDDRNKKTTIAERDAIPSTRRYTGLKCFVEQTSTEYMLWGGIENSDWIGVAGDNVSNALETVIEGFYVLSAGKTTLLDWEIGDKFRGWISNRYVVGTILSLPVSLPTDIDNSAKVELAIDSDGASTEYSKIVYVNSTDPASATIFDLNNPPTVNDDSLKNDVNNLYIGNDASTWVYVTTPAGYVTKTIGSGGSNFYLSGTTIDSGSNKSAAIERTGTVGGAPATASNHFMTKAQTEALVVGLLNDRGSWDASSGLFPTTGGSGVSGAVKKGDLWYVAVAGTLAGKAVEVGDSFRALVDTPGQTAGNWSVIETNLGYVPENVINKTGTIIGNEASTVLYAHIAGLIAYFQQKLTDSIFGAFINGLTSKTTPVDADSISIVDSADSNKQKKVSLTNFKAYLKTYFDSIYDYPQISITTAVNITTATNDSGGRGQKGRNVAIINGSTAINITVNGGTDFAASYLKTGTGNITFVQGSGRTLIAVDGTYILTGAVGSVASISSVGTTDYLQIFNS